MNTVYMFDFARCRCGFPTPIRPSMPLLPTSNRRLSETDDAPVVVACNECKRVFWADQLKSEQSFWGVGPYVRDAPMRIFQVTIPCDDLGCSAHLVAHVVLKSNTTDAELEEEKANWILRGMSCPEGHEFPWPPYREGKSSAT